MGTFRFEVALSFPGEHREFVERVARQLATERGERRILYDKFHEAEFARPNLDTYLGKLYEAQSELVVVFLCASYQSKEWCQLEWRNVRQIITSAGGDKRLMLLSFGDAGDLTSLGIVRGDGVIDIASRDAHAVAEMTTERLRLNRELVTPRPEAPAAPVADNGLRTPTVSKPRAEPEESQPSRWWKLGYLLGAGLLVMSGIAVFGGVRRQPGAGPSPDASSGNSGTGYACSVQLVSIDKGNEGDTTAFEAVAHHCQEKQKISVPTTAIYHAEFKKNWRQHLVRNPGSVFVWLAGVQVVQAMEAELLDEIPDEALSASQAAIKGPVLDDTSRLGEARFSIAFKLYPWALYYKQSILDQFGSKQHPEDEHATPPETWDELLDMLRRMKAAGLRPLAFAYDDKGAGWPAFGMFDILDMRINGFGFHSRLMRHDARWDSEEIRDVFQRWGELIPYYKTAEDERHDIRWWTHHTIRDAVDELERGGAGMYLIGGFMVKHLNGRRGDFGVFKFPEVPARGRANSEGSPEAIDAPIDSFVVSRTGPKDLPCTEALLKCLVTEGAFAAYDKENPGFLAASRDARKTYSSLQKQAADLVEAADRRRQVARFMDREMKGDFANKHVEPALKDFLERWPTDPNAPTGPLIGTVMKAIQKAQNNRPKDPPPIRKTPAQ